MKTLKKSLLFALTAALAAMLLASCSYRWLSLEEYASELKAAEDFSGGVALSGYDGALGTVDYGFDLPENAELEQKYGLSRVAGDGDELQKTKNLLAWVSGHVDHNGSVGQVVEKEDALHLLEYAFDQERGINCKMLAVTLSECLRAVGIKSRPIFIMPKGANSGDNHVVTHVYIDALRKWIMVDPSFNACFTDPDGNYLDCFELRARIADGAEILINDDFHYNHTEYSKETYLNYLAKNLFWFKATVNPDKNGWTCAPAGFEQKKWELDALKFQYDSDWIDKETYRNRKESIEKAEFPIVSKELFLSV